MSSWRPWTLAFALAAAFEAQADSWMAPCVEVVNSANQQWRLTVMPRGGGLMCRDSPEPTPAARRAMSPRSAHGTLERWQSGRWVRAWSRPLANSLRPVDAWVSNAGRVVTFDDWLGEGFGEHVVVLYDPDGRLVRALALSDLLPKPYVRVLPSSVSSVLWRAERVVAEEAEQLVLQVALPVAYPDDASAWPAQESVALRLDMRTGTVVLPTGPAWQRAWQMALALDAPRCAGERAELEVFKAPLMPPPRAVGDPLGDAWSRFALEAYRRLGGDEWRLPARCELLADELADEANARRCLRQALVEPSAQGPRHSLLATADPERTLPALSAVVGSLQRQALKHTTVYVTVTPGSQAAVARALAPTGARIVPIDLSRPIPQRRERLAVMQEEFGGPDGRNLMGACGPTPPRPLPVLPVVPPAKM